MFIVFYIEIGNGNGVSVELKVKTNVVGITDKTCDDGVGTSVGYFLCGLAFFYRELASLYKSFNGNYTAASVTIIRTKSAVWHFAEEHSSGPVACSYRVKTRN